MAAHRNLHLACACSASGSFALEGTARKYERSRPFAVTHQALDLELDFEGQAVSGTSTLDFIRRAPSGTTFSLDAVAFEIKSVTLKLGAGRARKLSADVDYAYDGDVLAVEIPASTEAGQLKIRYRAVPRQGLYFLRPDPKVPDRPLQVWSQCQDEDGRYFFPCQDKPHVKMTSEMRVTVPHGMTVLSGGRLVAQETPKRGPWVYHYRLDDLAPAYLMTLVAGEFDEWQEQVTLSSGRVIPLRYLVPLGKKADGQRAFAGTGEMIQLFSRLTGIEYPWDRYSQVVVSDFIFGGMENTTATTMYEHILLDERATLDIESRDLVAHELAHQWFGDLVTCRDWPHAWLNEGFATYFELVEKEARLGQDEYEEGVLSDFEAYLEEARGSYQRPIVCRDYEEPIDLFDRHLYQKGGVVLHLLRKELGDECFWAGIRLYLERHREGIVETNDLLRVLEEVSGTSLDAFFDHWVYRPGHPELSLKLSYAHGDLTLEVEQNQTGDTVPVFDLLVEMRAVSNKQELNAHKRIDSPKDSVVLRCDKRPTLVEIDPNFRLAATIDLSGPQDLLRAMLKKGRSARVRKLAATALGKRHDPENVQALGEQLASEKESYIVRAQAAASLAKIGGPQALAWLLEQTATGHPKVRRAIAQALGSFEEDQCIKALTQLTSDRSYLVVASAARSLGTLRRPEVAKTLLKLLTKSSWADVVRSGALDGLAKSGLPEAEEQLIEWSRYGKPARVRRTAIASLPKAAEGRVVREHLLMLLRDKDPHTRSAVLGALGALGDKKAAGPIGELLETELDGRVRRKARQVLADLGKTGTPGLSETRQKAQRLERELSGLKARIARLEQLTGHPKTHVPMPARTSTLGGDSTSSATAPVEAPKGLRSPTTPQRSGNPPQRSGNPPQRSASRRPGRPLRSRKSAKK